MTTFQDENLSFFPIEYTVTTPAFSSRFLRNTFSTVQGDPSKKTGKRNWVFNGQNLLPPLSETENPDAEFQSFEFRYDFSTSPIFPYEPKIYKWVSGTLSINRKKDVFNANRYVTVEQDKEVKPFTVTFTYRIPSCWLKNSLPSTVDFHIAVHDCSNPCKGVDCTQRNGGVFCCANDCCCCLTFFCVNRIQTTS
jgi:hypothetical protein